MARVNIETQIHDLMHALTAAEKRAARALLAKYPMIGLGPVAEFADESGVGAATVLRFVARMGFDSYPEFQRQLRDELAERMKSPLQKTPPSVRKGSAGEFLPRFVNATIANIQETATRLPASEFEAVCHRLADPRAACHVVGGRFTDAIAACLVAQLRVVRAGVRKLEQRPANAADQMLDVKAGDCAVFFDIRRYDDDLLRMAKALRARRARVILITDSWISPISRHAKYVLPCAVDVGRTWDSNAALFTLAEAIIARVTELSWVSARERIAAKEAMED
ncbi:MAG: MurR/RpiR family transcriptional regulator [Terricaulis sp.]|jgi:DNA-binding MurR/RpiR family transcriptional regulator